MGVFLFVENNTYQEGGRMKVKFRAWDKKNKTMLTWEQLRSEADFSWFGDDNLVFMRYIGLRDRQGVEIYEGDINLSFYHGEPNGTYLIEYSLYASHSGAYVDTISGYESNDPTQVIGNIYENPELLEVAE